MLNLMESTSHSKRSRDQTDDFDATSPVAKRFRDHLLDLLDDSDVCTTTTQDLDTFIKSFEDEITTPALPPVTVIDLTSDSGESGPELDYLFEASDNELGLPPSANSQSSLDVSAGSDLNRVSYDSTELSDLLKFVDQVYDYDPIETGFGYGDEVEEFFDYSDVGLGSLWPIETPPVI